MSPACFKKEKKKLNRQTIAPVYFPVAVSGAPLFLCAFGKE